MNTGKNNIFRQWRLLWLHKLKSFFSFFFFFFYKMLQIKKMRCLNRLYLFNKIRLRNGDECVCVSFADACVGTAASYPPNTEYHGGAQKARVLSQNEERWQRMRHSQFRWLLHHLGLSVSSPSGDDIAHFSTGKSMHSHRYVILTLTAQQIWFCWDHVKWKRCVKAYYYIISSWGSIKPPLHDLMVPERRKFSYTIRKTIRFKYFHPPRHSVRCPSVRGWMYACQLLSDSIFELYDHYRNMCNSFTENFFFCFKNDTWNENPINCSLESFRNLIWDM